MTTTLSSVYQKARSIVLQMLCSPSLQTADDDSRKCIEYETSLWVDGLTEECVDEFCSLLNCPSNNAFQHGIAVVQAWKNADFDVALPPICFSPLLTSSLTSIGSASEAFALYICQVVTKCLLYQRHPLALASVVANTISEINLDLCPINLLLQYSQRLLAVGAWDANECVSLMQTLVQSLFSPDCLHSVLMRSLQDATSFTLSHAHLFSDTDVEAAVRQCLHVLSVDSSTSDITKKALTQLRALIPLVKSIGADIIGANVDAIAQHPLVVSEHFPWAEMAYVNTVALIFQGNNATGSRHEKTDEFGIRIGADDLDASPNGSMQNLVLLSFWNTLVSDRTASRTMRQILGLICSAIRNKTPDAIASYASLALYWIENHERTKGSLSVPLDVALETWLAVIENCEKDNTCISLAHHLEALLSDAMNTEGAESSSLLYSLLLKNSPPPVTIHFCIQSKRLSSQLHGQESTVSLRPSLLSSLIVSDPIVFGTNFLDVLAQGDSNIDVPLLLEQGFFDEEIFALSKCDSLLKTEAFEKVRKMVVKRALTALSLQSETTRVHRGRRFHVDIATLLVKPDLLDSSHVDSVIDRACQSLRSKSKLKFIDDSWFRLSHKLLCSKNLCVFSSNNSREMLASTVLARALQMLQSSLKDYFRSNTAKEPKKSCQDCLEALDLVSKMIVKRMAYDATTLTDEVSLAATGAIKASLKYGLAHADDEANIISRRCLQLIRTLLVETFNPSSALHVLTNHCVLLNPSTILSLVVAHSHFHEVMTAAATQREEISADDPSILEFVRLLLVCTSMSHDTVLFESDIWGSLLTVYNAGTTHIDMTLRRLMDVYAEALAERGMVSCFGYFILVIYFIS